MTIRTGRLLEAMRSCLLLLKCIFVQVQRTLSNSRVLFCVRFDHLMINALRRRNLMSVFANQDEM